MNKEGLKMIEIAIPYIIGVDMVRDILENMTGERPTEEFVKKKVKELVVEIASSITDEYLDSTNVELTIAEVIKTSMEDD